MKCPVHHLSARNVIALWVNKGRHLYFYDNIDKCRYTFFMHQHTDAQASTVTIWLQRRTISAYTMLMLYLALLEHSNEVFLQVGITTKLSAKCNYYSW